MGRVIGKVIIYLGATVIAPVCLMWVAYQGFTTNYTRGTFSRASFQRSYSGSVFRYRLPAPKMLLGFHNALRPRLKLDRFPPDPRLKLLDKDAGSGFYIAYFFFNTLFAILAAILLAVFLRLRAREWNLARRMLLVILISAVVAFTQFVITPYDVISYAYLILLAVIYLADRPIAWAAAALIMIPATLNREGAAVFAAFAWALYLNKYGFKIHRDLLGPVLVSAAFIGTYVGVRLVMGGSGTSVFSWTLPGNLVRIPELGLLAILFWALAAFHDHAAKRRLSAWFLLTVSPYLVVVLLFGLVAELRIFVPVIICLAFFHAMDDKYVSVAPSS